MLQQRDNVHNDGKKGLTRNRTRDLAHTQEVMLLGMYPKGELYH
jgi:hypothetical protein